MADKSKASVGLQMDVTTKMKVPTVVLDHSTV